MKKPTTRLAIKMGDLFFLKETNVVAVKRDVKLGNINSNTRK
jgi:hypothetical protein